jgi:hypothetical protein
MRFQIVTAFHIMIMLSHVLSLKTKQFSVKFLFNFFYFPIFREMQLRNSFLWILPVTMKKSLGICRFLVKKPIIFSFFYIFESLHLRLKNMNNNG